MKYMVMTTKHHEGFCLWDTQQTDYNAVKCGPRRDLVQEYVDACREFDLKIGFYYSLMDWHHPDGAVCAKDEAARRRFLDFTQGCVRELRGAIMGRSTSSGMTFPGHSAARRPGRASR